MNGLQATRPDALVEDCLASLRRISDSLDPKLVTHRGPSLKSDAKARSRDVDLTLGDPAQRYRVVVKRTHLSYALVEGLLGEMRDEKRQWVLLAPYVASPMGQFLTERGVNYVDGVGNVHLSSGKTRHLVAHVEGKKPIRNAATTSGSGTPAYLVTFAILARPDLLNESVRTIAAAAGVGKTTVAAQLARLEDQGLLERSRGQLRLAQPRALLDRWVSGYVDIVRPRLMIGRYRTRETDPVQLEKQLEKALPAATWAFGGGTAAWRLLHHHRGTETIVHTIATTALPATVRAVGTDDGNLTVLSMPAPLAFEGVKPETAHPLLVYTEMLMSRDPRVREHAEDVRREFLGALE